MNRIAPAIKVFALLMMFISSTTASVAYDLQLGGRLYKRHSQGISVPADLSEYQALSVPRANGYYAADSSDYMPDVTGQGIYRWEVEKLPIKIWISDGRGVPGYRPEMGRYIRTSFDWWCQASGNKLAWVEVNNPSKADITVNWTDRVFERPEGTEAGKTSALTRLNTQTQEGIIYGARMQMLTRLPGREFGNEEVAKTCLHEAGHAFGLQGHSHYRGDIMYYAVSHDQDFRLSERDKTTISRLYDRFPVADGLAAAPKPAPALTNP